MLAGNYNETAIGQGKFFTGDCFDVMRDLPDGSVDMILCDLPYGTTRNKWDSVIPFEPLWREYWRVCKPTAAVALTASQPFTSALVMSQVERFRHEWIWVKNRGSNFANTVREPMKEHESVCVFSKGKWTYNKQMQERYGLGLAVAGKMNGKRGGFAKTTNYGKGNTDWEPNFVPEKRVPSSHQRFDVVGRGGIHPTQKPVALFEYLIRTYTNPGELVLDNTAGSGTTAVAAENADRRWICIERDQDYATKAIQRIRDHVGESAMAEGERQ